MMISNWKSPFGIHGSFGIHGLYKNMMILNWKSPFGAHGLYKNISAL